MKKNVSYTIIACVMALGVFSCNMFSSIFGRNPEAYGGEALVQEGKLKMRDGDWTAAISLFDQALAKDSGLSEAYFYKGKCILRISHVDLAEVWGDINPSRADSDAVPFLFKAPPGRSFEDSINPFWFDFFAPPRDTAYTLVDSVFLERKRIYDAVCQAIKYLEKIYYHSGEMDGVVTRKQYESDYLVEISIKTILGLADLDSNDVLDFRSDERKTFKILAQDISSLDPDSMSFDSLKQISKNPQEINQRIEATLALVGKADTSYMNFEAELAEGAEKSDQIDIAMAKPLGDMIRQLDSILPYFYYADKVDNDGDFYNTDTIGEGGIVRIDPMIWIDWDGDHQIDFFASTSSHDYIGSESHKAAHPELYDFIDPPGHDFRRYRYKGGHGYEFISGDWGVDEERMDKEDNDMDGLVDEDTRTVADTLDDILGDPADNNSVTPGDTVPFVWIDGNNNFYIDNGEAVSGSPYVDDEWFDGWDNDRDGAVDEDVNEDVPPETSRGALIDSLNSKK